ncbi:MAG: radical SAM protein [Candidatus Gastranaerophilales bacterium]|nr:radical SAM protein [Candidatus Gastranaerophilales bacterium]
MGEVKRERYISCKWLESGVCFDNGVYGSNVKLCCYMSAPGGGNSMIFENYKGSKIDWDKFFKIKNEYRNVQKSGNTVPGCVGCVFLEEKEWLQENYIDSIIFDHFTKCNCACTYCYTEEDKKGYNKLKTYDIYPIIKDMFDKKIIRTGGAIGFGGGEPTILPEFDKLIDLFLKNGFSNMRVPSSGIKYSKMIEKGISTGQLSVVISIDSSSREMYKKIKQVDFYDTVCKNLKKYSKAQKKSFNVISKYIIIPEVNDTKVEIDNWLKFNKENNIGIIVIDIENSWLTKYRNDKPDERIVELLKYVVQKSKDMNFYRLEICDRARYLVGD